MSALRVVININVVAGVVFGAGLARLPRESEGCRATSEESDDHGPLAKTHKCWHCSSTIECALFAKKGNANVMLISTCPLVFL